MQFEGEVKNGQIILSNVRFILPERLGFRKEFLEVNALIDTGATSTCFCGNLMASKGVPIRFYQEIQSAQSNAYSVPFRAVLFNEFELLCPDYKSCKDNTHNCLIGMNLIEEIVLKDERYKVVLRTKR